MNKNTIIGLAVLAFIVVAAAIAVGIVLGTGSSDSKTTPTSEFIQPFGNDENAMGNKVFYADSTWVAVGLNKDDTNSSNIVYSSDGETWNRAVMDDDSTQPFGNDGAGLDIYHEGISWVAVGVNSDYENSSNIVWSSDGQNWNCAQMVGGISLFIGGQGGAIYHAGSSWVAVGYTTDATNSSNIVWSSDGQIWNRSVMDGGTSPPFGIETPSSGGAIYHAGSSWVAVGESQDTSHKEFFSTIVWSSDGQTWNRGIMTGGTSPPFGNGGSDFGNDVYNDGTSWVAVGKSNDNYSSNIVWSSDGQNWNCAQMAGSGDQPFGNGVGNAIYSNGTSWVAVGSTNGTDAGTILYSTDAATWFSAQMADSSQPFGTTGEVNAISHDGTSWVAVGNNSDATNSSNILYSTDAENWFSAQMADSSQPFGTPTFSYSERNGISFNGTDKWVAVGNNEEDNTNSSNIVYSSDRINWYKGEMTS